MNVGNTYCIMHFFVWMRRLGPLQYPNVSSSSLLQESFAVGNDENPIKHKGKKCEDEERQKRIKRRKEGYEAEKTKTYLKINEIWAEQINLKERLNELKFEKQKLKLKLKKKKHDMKLEELKEK